MVAVPLVTLLVQEAVAEAWEKVRFKPNLPLEQISMDSGRFVITGGISATVISILAVSEHGSEVDRIMVTV